MLKKLPVGIQTFRELRRQNCLYVDKTKDIFPLVAQGGAFFFSRPRRFGKSMTISTLASIYRGEKHLFEDLWMYDKWDWTRKHPIIHISFNDIGVNTQGLEVAIRKALLRQATDYGLELLETNIDQCFRELIEKLCDKHGKVVILIDEYDKPLIDYLAKEDLHIAKAHQKTLKSFYSVLKSADEKIELLFITGVSKFSRVSIFSDLNHLDDVTLDKRFATLVGYTLEEILANFPEWLADVHENFPAFTFEELLAQIKQWYNGYSWDGKKYVYNPFSILNFCNKHSFEDYWFKTGTPTFLINLLKERNAYNFDDIKVNRNLFDSYDLDNLETRSLLFQTGYLTIKNIDTSTNVYTLGYPNQEVAEAMFTHLLGAFGCFSSLDATMPIIQIREAFFQNDLARAIKIINSLFKDIPYDLFKRQNELYYHALVHLMFNYLGVYVQSEVEVSDGRLDAVVQTPTHIYIFEFKIDKTAAEAIAQIKSKDYAAKFHTVQKKIVGIGVNFSSEIKGVESWESEEVN
jgi:Predicted AAA-ATPase/PD-(D/E)XK nuclease superfamily